MANLVVAIHLLSYVIVLNAADISSTTYSIGGKLSVGDHLSIGHEDWLRNTHIHTNNGEFVGVPNRDGKFAITGVPTGSYVVEVSHPTFIFEPFRVEINSKGKIRARKLNNIQPGKVETVEYPLVFKAQGKAPYFQKREEWRITDMLLSPMVLMMLLPMVLLFLLPKMMNMTDPESQKELQSQMNMLRNPNQQMPELSETLASFFGGGAPQTKSKKAKSQRN